MRSMFFALLGIVLSTLVMSQTPDEIQKKAMEKFTWLEGEWEGIAWSQTRSYQWHAWRIPGGIYNEHEPELSENGFTWAMETPRANIRYTITHTHKDGWFEIGEFSADDHNWFKFFEMSLRRSH